MATPTLPAGASPANVPTRRMFIGGALAAPALAAVPALASRPTILADWDRLVASYRAAKVAEREAGRLYSEREGAFFNRRPDAPQMSKTVSRITDGMTWGEIVKLPSCPHLEAHERATAAWVEECAAVRAEAMDDVEACYDAALDRSSAALSAVAAYPVPTLAMLAEKVDLLAGAYEDDFGHGVESKHLAADIRRLARMA